MDEIHYWAEMQSELKNGFAEMGSALAKLIRAAEARNVPPLLEAVSLQVTPQRINRRGYTFAYLLVSEETLKALGTSLITLQMGTFVAQVQAGVGLVQLPLVEDGYISVPGLTGSWDALVYLTNEQAPSVTPLGSTTTSPLITELTGSLAPLVAGVPALLITTPYTSLPANSDNGFVIRQALHRNIRNRTFFVVNNLNIDLTSVKYYLFDSTINGGDDYITTAIGSSGAPPSGDITVDTSEAIPGLSAHADSILIEYGVGSTAPISGYVYLYVTEVF